MNDISTWQAALAFVLIGLLFGVGFHVAGLLVNDAAVRLRRRPPFGQ
jgi:hypothetical protein